MIFNEMMNVGKAKHVVNFHDGIKANKDGSPFFDIRIFRNQRKKNTFVKSLLKVGYVER